MALSAGIVACSFLLQVLPDQRVALVGLPRLVLPPACFSRTVLGISCPGCGLTRSFIHLAHGDWRASYQVHQLGWLLAVTVVAQLPYRLWALARGPKSARHSQAAFIAAIALVALLVANWLLNLLRA